MDYGHYNCRDYYITPHFSATTIVNESVSLQRHESWDELEHRARSPASLKPKFPLLQLPLELRQQILGYVLPHTQGVKDTGRLGEHARNFSAVKKRGAKGMLIPSSNASLSASGGVSNVVWQRGNIHLFSVCKQLHHECAELVYGTNTFLLFVTYEGIKFRFRWLLPSGLAPSRSYDFLGLMPARYLQLVKRVIVHVDHVDSYTGMVKFGREGKGLARGLKRQVQKLAIALGSQIDHSEDGNKHLAKIDILFNKSESSQQQNATQDSTDDTVEILEPFGYLRGVREVSIGGAVSASFAAELAKIMRSTQSFDMTSVKLIDAGMSASNTSGGVQLCVYGNDL